MYVEMQTRSKRPQFPPMHSCIYNTILYRAVFYTYFVRFLIYIAHRDEQQARDDRADGGVDEAADRVLPHVDSL